MTLKKDDDGNLPSFYSSCRFCENADVSKNCAKLWEAPSLITEVIRGFHERFWKEMNHAERRVARGCPGFQLSSWCVKNNSDHFGEPVVKKTPKGW